MQSFCEARGYGVVRDLVGHGVGRSLHEDPQVPNVGRRGVGKKLKAGMTLCVEPMITGGTSEVAVDADGWTVRTADGEPAAHYEHMILVNRGEPTRALLVRAHRGGPWPRAGHSSLTPRPPSSSRRIV